jgi:hypothetical protein
MSLIINQQFGIKFIFQIIKSVNYLVVIIARSYIALGYYSIPE